MLDPRNESPRSLIVWIIVSVGAVYIGAIATTHLRDASNATGKDAPESRLEQMEHKLAAMQHSNEELLRTNKELGTLLQKEMEARRNTPTPESQTNPTPPQHSQPSPSDTTEKRDATQGTDEMEKLKQDYESRRVETERKVEESKRAAIQKAIAQNPWCDRCKHYHPASPRGCPIGPATHHQCGTKHWLDEVCPAFGFRVPPPGAAH